MTWYGKRNNMLRFSARVLFATVLLCSCRQPALDSKLTVAAAANLVNVFDEVGRAFKANTGIDVVFSYGSTAQLAQQIEHGAPFDVFAAADTEHIDSLIAQKKITADSRAVYALGQLVLWIPNETSGVRAMQDLAGSRVRYISIAQPELAPYGRASVEALKHSGLWEGVHSKVVYANNINQAKQMAQSGNADATFTAYSLVLHERGTILKIDPALYQPIEQGLGIAAGSSRQNAASQFREFLLGAEGRGILGKSGYILP
jgi:molybdate transport system substrate-binding protein